MKIYNTYEYTIINATKMECIGLYKTFNEVSNKALEFECVFDNRESKTKNFIYLGDEYYIIHLRWYYIIFKVINSDIRTIDKLMKIVENYTLNKQLNILLEL